MACLLGPKGTVIRGIQTRTGCRLEVTEHLWDPTLKTIELEGIKSAVLAAKREILDVKNSNCLMEVEFPSDRIGSLIGKSGATMSKIQKDNKGVRINIVEHEWDTAVKDVHVVGPVASVKAAVEEIEKIKADLEAQAQARREKEIAIKAERARRAAEEEAARAAEAAAAAAEAAAPAATAIAAN